jgi:signal transduction histidine kinase
MVKGHHDALQRALSNVLLNAADASGPGGRIEIGVGLTSSADAVEIQVRDSGPGIPEDRIKTIWEPYMTTKPGGTGLGLAIARQAILAHDGSIDIQCPPGGGTVVTFVLPAQRPAAT